MSYILDALRKSDQQRQHAKAPTLLTTHSTPDAPKSSTFSLNAWLAALLIAAGILIGWLRPWHSEAPPVARVTVTTQSKTSTPVVATALPSVVAKPDVHSLLPLSTPIAKPAPPQPKPASSDLAPETAAPPPASPTPGAPEKMLLKQSELPAAVQQTLPSIMMAFHQYASSPADRRVMINNLVLHQGELIAPGLKLEQITPDGVVISYQGYHFLRGVR